MAGQGYRIGVTSLWMLLFGVLSVWSAPTPESSTDIIGVEEPSAPLVDWLQTASIGESAVVDSGAFTLLNITRPTDVHKRQGGCYSYSVLQTNVDRTGTWWGDWYKVTGCQSCGKNGNTCHLNYGYSTTVSWSVSFGFDTGGTSAAENAINGNAGLNLGFTWQTSTSTSESYGCDVSSGDSVSLWRQDQKGWSDTAQRYLVTTVCQTGIGNKQEYSGWTFGHVDWALQGNQPYNMGCSGGYDAHCTW